MFEHGAWYTGAIKGVEYIKSPTKGTPGLQITVDVSDRVTITGVWWLTNAMVSDPNDKARKVPQWEAAQIRCKQFGCTQAGLTEPQTWLDHIRQTLTGQQASVLAEVNNYGDTAAAIIAWPKSGGGSKFVVAQPAASPFAARPANADPFAVSEDDLPF